MGVQYKVLLREVERPVNIAKGIRPALGTDCEAKEGKD